MIRRVVVKADVVVVVGIVVVPVGRVDLGVIVIKLTVEGNEVVVVKGPAVVVGVGVVVEVVEGAAVDVEDGEELCPFVASGPSSLEKEV